MSKPSYEELEKELFELKSAPIESSKNPEELINKLKQSEEKLKTSYEFLDQIINNIYDPVFVKDDQSRLTHVNDAFCDIFGVPRIHVIGKTLAEHVPIEEREHFLKIDKEVIESGKVSLVEEQLSVTDKPPLTIRTKKTRFINKDGDRFLIGVIHDITDIAKSEKDNLILEQNQFYLSKAQEIGKIGHFNMDPTTNKVDGSDVLYKLFDVDPDQPLFEAFSKAIHPEDRDLIFPFIDRTIKEGTPYDVEYRVKHRDGTVLHLNAKGEIFETRQGRRMMSTVQDITEKINSEKEKAEAKLKLENSEKELNEAQKLAHIGSWLFDPSSEKPEWSEEMFSIWGFDPKKGTPEYDPIVKRIHPDDIELYYSSVAKSVSLGTPYDIELRINLPNDEQKTVIVICQPVIDVTGKVTSLAGTCQDITERKLAEVELISIKENAEEINQKAKELRVLNNELLKAKERTEKREKDYKDVVETTADLITVVDDQGTIIFTNYASLNFYGLTPQECKGRSAFDFIYSEDVELTKDEFNKWVNSSNSIFHFENRQVSITGVILNVSWSIHFERVKNDVIKVTSIGRDITEKKKAEIELRIAKEKTEESESKFEQLFEMAQEGIWVIDKNFYTDFVNPSMAKMLGYSIEEMKGKHLFDFMDENGVEIAKYNLNNRQEGVSEQHDFEFVNKKGEKVIAVIEAAPIMDDEGNYNGAIAGVMDITQRNKMEQELRENEASLERKVLERTVEVQEKNVELSTINDELKSTNDELLDTLEKLKSTQSQLVQSEKMASLGVLTAGIAHEINNPVNFVYAGINALEDNLNDVRKVLSAYEEIDLSNIAVKLPEIEKIKSNLQYDKLLYFVDQTTSNIKRGAERTTEIIKGLKTFSRLDNDQLVLADMNENLDNTLLILRSQYKDKITIDKKYGDIPKIECYSGKLNQVFVNIIANAIDAIDGEGNIAIVTSKCIKKGNDYLEVRISDTGVGMSDDIVSRIFEPFFTTKDVGQGTGLGLSISLGVIESHKGFMDVESEEGKGTTFNIYLPL